MKKQSGPDTTITVPPLETCTRCKGRAVEKPMFHEMVCGDCGGAGFVDAATGFALDPGIALVALNRSYHRMKAEIRDLRAQLAQCNCSYDPYGPLPERLGGKWRGD